MTDKAKEKPQLDARTKFVFDKKGCDVEYKLAEGAFGKVYRARDMRHNRTDAVKVMDLTKMSPNFRTKFLAREIMALIKIRHPNVIQVHDIFRSNQNIYIFMEFACNGSLSGQIKQSENGFLDEGKARFWFKQTCDALECMHIQHKMCHRDIKVENVLLDAEMNAKLSDFGFAKDLSEFELSRTFCGTEPYFAPELVMKLNYNPYAVDIWALGVLLYVMLNGRFPFHFRDLHKDKNIMLKEQKAGPGPGGYVFRPEVVDKLSDSAKEALARIMTFDAERRPDIQTVQKLPFLQNVKNISSTSSSRPQA